MENEFEQVEDKDWEDRKSTKESRKEESEKAWQEDKENWQKLDNVEEFNNTLGGKWVQRGPYLVNKSSKLEYATYIGMDHILVGIDADGKPMLKKRS
jgi:hypothetical protein